MEANHTARNKYVYAPNILFGKWDEVPSKQHHACMQSLHGFSRHEQPKIGYWNRNPRKHFYAVYGVASALLCPQDLVHVEATNLTARSQSEQHRDGSFFQFRSFTNSYKATRLRSCAKQQLGLKGNGRRQVELRKTFSVVNYLLNTEPA